MQVVKGGEEVGCNCKGRAGDVDIWRRERRTPGVGEGLESGDVVGCEGNVGECEVNGVFKAAWKQRQEPNVVLACQRSVLVWR